MTSMSPFDLAVVIALVVAVVTGFLAFRAPRTIFRVVLAAVTLSCALPAVGLFALVHPEYIDGRFRAYKAFYDGIHEGMTREEVFAVMEQCYPQSGTRQRPKVVWDEPARLAFFMAPESSEEPNCEGIFLELADGRVAVKQYSAD